VGEHDEWEWRWQRAKEQFFKKNAEKFTQGMGTFKVPPNPKWLRYEFDTPVRFWSKGRFALNVNDVEFDPWFNASWKYRKTVTFAEQSNTNLTGYPVQYWFEHGGNAQADCDDVRPIAPDGSEIGFNSTSCNSTHVRLSHYVDVNASASNDYTVYYGNPDAAQSGYEAARESFDDLKDSFEDGSYSEYPSWRGIVTTGLEVSSTTAGVGDKSIHAIADTDAEMNISWRGDTNLTGEIFWWMSNEYTAQGGFYFADYKMRAADGDVIDCRHPRDDPGAFKCGSTNTGKTTVASGLGQSKWYNTTYDFVNSTAVEVTVRNMTGQVQGSANFSVNNQSWPEMEVTWDIGNPGDGGEVFYDRLAFGDPVSPEPSVSLGPEHTSPKIMRISVPDIHKNEDFLVNVKCHCISQCPRNTDNLTIELPAGFTMPDDKTWHPNPYVPSGEVWTTIWEVKAPSTTGSFLLNVSGPLNEKTNNITVRRNIFDIEDMIKYNLTEELRGRWQELNATYLNETELERQIDTRDIIKTNLTEELENRWQNLNASYLNGTAIERVRALADYLNETRWGSYIASDLYDVANDSKTIARYINQSRWLDKTASDLYDMSKDANSTAEAARKIADYINQSRWIEKNATELYEMSKQANSTAELARELSDYINQSRWIDTNASELKSISTRARDLADYINGTKWGDKVASDLMNVSVHAKNISKYLNETRWKGFTAKDIFSESESARKEAERTYEEMHDMKRVLIKQMRKTVLEALGIKSSRSSSSSHSSGGGSSVPTSSPPSTPKKLPTGKATESKGRGIIGGVVHFFARGVKGLGLIAQSVTGG